MKYDVFISYSRKDKKIVNTFVDRLTSDGFTVWIDKDGIESGDAFKHVIVSAIEQSSVVVFFSSESSNTSRWTSKEIGVAIYENKPIIPVKLDNAKYNSEIKFDLINLDYIDLSGSVSTEDAYNRLVRTLRHKCNKSVEEPVTVEPEKPSQKGGVNFFGIKLSRTNISLLAMIVVTMLWTGLIGGAFWLLVLLSSRSKNHRKLWEWVEGHQRLMWKILIGLFIVIGAVCFYLDLSSSSYSSDYETGYAADSVAEEVAVPVEAYDYSEYDTIAADTTVAIEEWPEAVSY